jgi:hypothetical protein
MRLHKYNQFLDIKPINENVSKSKKFLKERYLLMKAAKETGLLKGELKAQIDHSEIRSITLNDFTDEERDVLKNKVRELRLSVEEIQTIERDADYIKLKELLHSNIGYLYNFTYMFFIENIPMEEVQRLYSKVLEYKDLLVNMPKPFDVNFIDPSKSNNAETLEDSLDNLEVYRKVKKVVDRLTSGLKIEYKNAIPTIKEKFDSIASAFYELGKDENGDVSNDKRDRLWETFFGAIRRYKTLNEFIRGAENYLKASSNSNIVSFYEKINDCNEKMGMAGCNIVFDDSGILILEVKSYQANKMLNSHTRHCIASSSSYWDSYVTNHTNKQYYIYDFNIPQHDNKCVIGITIEAGQRVKTAHDKADSSVSSSTFKSILTRAESNYGIKEDLWSLFQPMTREEIEIREKSKMAEREIVKKGISKELITEYVKENGANINKDNGVCLSNAVEEDDIEKVQVILKLGASPNLKEGSNAPISKAKNLAMIKLLVSNGSDITGEVFNNILHDMDALEYCLKSGLDPNFNNFLPFRRVCKGSWTSIDTIGESYLGAFKLLLKYGAKLADDRGRNMIIKWAAEYSRLDMLDWLESEGSSKDFTLKEWEEAITWISHSRKINKEIKSKVISYLENEISKKS